MCLWCESLTTCNYHYADNSFCSQHCVDAYKKSEQENKQKKIEEIDREINRLKEERKQLMDSLGFEKNKYPW